ncbi:MAG: hypothetical protein ACREHV_13895 [Rhizomicrobium sp.]
MPRTPNYSFERLQRERSQKSKSEEKAEKRAAKSAERKARKDEQTAEPDAVAPKREGES